MEDNMIYIIKIKEYMFKNSLNVLQMSERIGVHSHTMRSILAGNPGKFKYVSTLVRLIPGLTYEDFEPKEEKEI
jgi:DNA-binding Xre family transcriptional regulator